MTRITRNNYWVYILRCENNSYYTGYTKDILRRYSEHVNDTGRCKYTRSFKPITIAQCWRIKGSKSLAMHLENVIKRLSKIKKEELILMPLSLSADKRVQPVKKQALQSILTTGIEAYDNKNIKIKS